MKKIYFTLGDCSLRGVQTLLISIINNLPPLYEYGIIFFTERSKQEEILFKSKLTKDIVILYLIKYQEKNFLRIKKLIRLRRIVKHNKIDIVHCHIPMPHYYVFWATVFLKTKLIATFHNTEMWPGKIRRFVSNMHLNLYLNKFTNYTAISQLTKENMVMNHRIEPEKVKVIYNGIDSQNIDVSKYDDHHNFLINLGLNTNAIVLTNIAALNIEHKGQDRLIKEFLSNLSNFPNAYLLLVGGGNDEFKLKSLTKAYANSDHVIFLGVRSDIYNILHNSDFFVLSSNREGLPISLLEAMQARVSIISTDVGSIPEVITDGIHGTLIPNNEFCQFSNKLLFLLNNPDIKQQLVINASERIKDFTITSTVNNLIMYYKDILSNE